MAAEQAGIAYRSEGVVLDTTRGTLIGPDGVERALRPKPFSLLVHLLERQGRLLSRDELLTASWPDVVVTDDSLTQCISDLRKAFGEKAAAVSARFPSGARTSSPTSWWTGTPRPRRPPRRSP